VPDLGELEGDLQKKEGPLPVWGWVVLVVGAGAVVVIIRRRSAASAAATTSSTGSAAAAAPATDLGSSLGAVSGTSTASGATDDGTDQQANGATSYADNGAWSSAAATYLEADGFAATTVDSFLSDYLGGQPLSAQETAMKVIVLAELGYPPVSIITNTSSDTTTTTPTTDTTTTTQGGIQTYLNSLNPPTPTPTPAPTPTPSTNKPTPVTPTPAKVTAPATPGGFALGSTGTTLTFSWDASAGATSYQILNSSGAVAASTTGTSYSIPGAVKGHAFSYAVRAVNSAGTSAPTAYHTHTIPLTA
jgi:hypothetical protein